VINVGVVVFPGSNCDVDFYYFCKDILKWPVKYLWHQEKSIGEADLVVLPGGFSYGDYLRPGAIARYSPIMEAVEHHAHQGGLVLGICNGFQVLTEAGLLPGALYRNLNLQFRCVFTNVRIDSCQTPYTYALRRGEVLSLPVANGDGNYYAEKQTLKQMEEKGQIVFRYTNQQGEITSKANPSGSLDNIAGICNSRGNVLGMMPHPERASNALLGGEDGLKIFQSLRRKG